MLLVKKNLKKILLILACAIHTAQSQHIEHFGDWRVVTGLSDDMDILNEAALYCQKHKADCKTLYLRGELPIKGIPEFDEYLQYSEFFHELLFVVIMDYQQNPPAINFWKNCDVYPRPYPDSPYPKENVCIHISDEQLMQLLFGTTLSKYLQKNHQPNKDAKEKP